MEELLQAGIAAAKAGELERARALLTKAVQQDVRSEQGWLWLGRCLVEPERREYCFRRALALDPESQAAQELAFPAAKPNILVAGTLQDVAATRTVVQASAQAASPQRAGSKPAAKARSSEILVWVFLLTVLAMGVAGVAFLILFPQAFGLSSASQTPAAMASTETPFSTATPWYTWTSSPTATITLTPLPDTPTPTITPNPARALILAVQAEAEWQEAKSQHYESEYYRLLAQALQNIDEAIALMPAKGDFYYQRFLIYEAYWQNEAYIVNSEAYIRIGLENAEHAVALGNRYEWSERTPPILYFHLRRCDEGMQLLEQIKTSRGASAAPSAGLLYVEAIGNLCLGNLEKALELINQSIEIESNLDRRILRTELLYNLGREADALEQINTEIAEKPQFQGWRYYIRALIYYEMGKSDLAQQDIEIGTNYTWARHGLRSYVLGRLALDRGEIDSGIAYLKDAYLSTTYENPRVLKQIEEELEKRHAGLPEQSPVSILIQPTPLPLLPPLPTPTPWPTVPPGSIPTPPFPTPFSLEQGSGRMLISLNAYPVLLIQPSQAVSLQRVKSLTLRIVSASYSGQTPFVIFLWDFHTGEWVKFQPQWGDNPIHNPERFVDPQAHIFLSVRYPMDESGVIDNIACLLVAETVDGVEVKFGY